MRKLAIDILKGRCEASGGFLNVDLLDGKVYLPDASDQVLMVDKNGELISYDNNDDK